MTLLARNNCFKVGIALAALSLGLVGICGYFAFSAFPEVSVAAAMRPGGIILKFIESFAVPSAYVPFWIMLASSAYSLISIILIYYFFEKTESPEILFIGFFVISVAFELARLAIPLRAAIPFSSMYLIAANRIMLFGRYFGMFSLFAASAYAAGLDSQKQHNVFFLFAMATLLIILNIPVDSLTWDSSFKIVNGNSSMLALLETGFLAITVFTFLVAAYIRGSRRYISIGIGAFMMLSGRNILLLSDTWLSPLPGLALLAAGTWLVCSRLHKEYLWL